MGFWIFRTAWQKTSMETAPDLPWIEVAKDAPYFKRQMKTGHYWPERHTWPRLKAFSA